MASTLPGFEDFSSCVGDEFRFDGEGEQLSAELIEAKKLGEAQDRPFSLLFRIGEGPVLPQRIYSVEHQSLGPFDLFIVPIGPDEVGMTYEAIFS